MGISNNGKEILVRQSTQEQKREKIELYLIDTIRYP
jgi:hypothetical protein